LDGTARRYSIGGREGYDPRMFLNAAEMQVTTLLARSRQSRFYLVLSCDIERPDVRTGEVVTANPFFSARHCNNIRRN